VLGQGVLNPRFGSGTREAHRAAVLHELGFPASTRLVLGCGTVDRRKGADLFVEVARRVLEDAHGDEETCFVWVGAGRDNQYDSTAFWTRFEQNRVPSLKHRVRFIGERESAEPYFMAADLFLMTSRADPFPCVVHEAMSCGLAVIGFENATGSPEALGPHGLFVPYEDVDAMAARAIELLRDDARRHELGRGARQRVREHFAFRRYYESLRRITCDPIGIEEESLGAPKLPTETDRRVLAVRPCTHDAGRLGTICGILDSVAGDDVATELLVPSGRFDPLDDSRIDVPYRFLQPRDRSAHAMWSVLERSVLEHAPCAVVFDVLSLASAIVPRLPDDVAAVVLATQDGIDEQLHLQCIGPYCNRIVITSEPLAERLRSLAPSLADRIVLVPETAWRGIDHEAGDAERLGDATLRLVVAASGRDRASGFDWHAALLRELLEGDTPASCTIIADQNDLELLAEIGVCSIDAGVLALVDEREHEAVAEALSRAHLFIDRSDAGRRDATLWDSMSCGCVPVCRTDDPGLAGVLEDGRNAFVAEIQDPSALARILEDLHVDRQRWRRLSRAAAEAIDRRGMSAARARDRYRAVFGKVFDELDRGSFVRSAARPAEWDGLVVPPSFARHWVQQPYPVAEDAPP
jgi:glycosyltransferase involved in cell wall biosynthesis